MITTLLYIYKGDSKKDYSLSLPYKNKSAMKILVRDNVMRDTLNYNRIVLDNLIHELCLMSDLIT